VTDAASLALAQALLAAVDVGRLPNRDWIEEFMRAGEWGQAGTEVLTAMKNGEAPTNAELAIQALKMWPTEMGAPVVEFCAELERAAA
jgi:hypothetical protein